MFAIILITARPQALAPIIAVGLLAMIGLLGACGSDAHEGEGPGHAEYPNLTFWQRTAIGGTDAVGPAAFGSVIGAALYEDSLLAVADGHSQEIHVFDLNGEHIRRLAGEGVGPGMAKAIQFISFASDGGICMWDRQLTRMTRWGGTDSAIQTWSPIYDSFSMMYSKLVGMADDCSSAVFRDLIRSEVAQQVGTNNRGMVQLVDTLVYTAVEQNKPARELARWAAPPVWMMRSEQLNSVHEVILGKRFEAAMVGTTLWVGMTDSLSWRRVDLSGRELSPVRLPTNRRPTTAQDIEHERARRKQEAPSFEPLLRETEAQRFVAAHNRGIEEVPASEWLPALDAMIAGSDQILWVREASPYAAAAENWFLVTADGIPLGRLSLPKGGEPVAGSSGVLVMRNSDSLDAEYLRVLKISRDPIP